MTREYYQKNRLEILKKTRARYEKDCKSKTYRELTRLRSLRWDINESILLYQRKIGERELQRIEIDRRIEELELEWGKERAERKGYDSSKRAGRSTSNRSLPRGPYRMADRV